MLPRWPRVPKLLQKGPSKLITPPPFFEPFSKPCSKGHGQSIQSVQRHQKALEMLLLPPKISTETHQIASRSEVKSKKWLAFPHAKNCIFGPSRRLLAHVFLVLKSQIINLAGVSPMQSNVFWAMLKTQYQVASLMQIALLAHVILVLKSQIRNLAGVPPHAEQCVFGHDENTAPGCQPHADCFVGTCDSGARK